MAEPLVIPPRPSWDQGDIAEAVYFAALDEKRPGALLTLACDIAEDKVDLWTFAVLYPDVEIARTLVRAMAIDWTVEWDTEGKLRGATRNQRDSARKKMKELIAQKFPRYHWLPVEVGADPAHVADFSCVTSLPVDEIRTSTRRVASLSSSWREQLPARYAAFMGRVGVHDYADKIVDDHVARLSNEILAG